MPPTTPNPFPHGGSFVEGVGWVDSNHPLYQAPQPQPPAQPAQPEAPAQPAAPAAPPQSGSPGPGWTPYGEGGWLPPGHPAAGPAAPPSAGPAQPPPSAGPAQPPAGTAPPGPTTPQGQPLATNAAQISQPFYQTLHSLLSQTTPVTADDPQIKNQVNAARAAEERNFAKQRAMMAERAAAEGTSMSGGFNAMLANERAGIGQRMGQLSADAVRQLQTERMGQIMTALSIGQGIMSEGDRNVLQRELANLDAALRREGMSAQAGEGAAERALRQALQTESLGFQGQEGAQERALRQALADMQNRFNYSQLGQQDEQFRTNLSANIGMNEAQLAQAMVLALLGGD